MPRRAGHDLPCDVLQVPPDGDFLSLHQRIACGVAYGQQAAAHTTAQRDEVPVLPVLHETLHVFGQSACLGIEHGIEGDAANDECDVVHHSADGSHGE